MLASIPATIGDFPRGSEILQNRVNETVLTHRGTETTKCLMCDGNSYSDVINTVFVMMTTN